MMRSHTKIATALGMDSLDVFECRYQPSRFDSPAVYAIGQKYMAVSKAAPKHKEFAWAVSPLGYDIWEAAA